MSLETLENVCIIIPVYNRQNYIKQCIESLVNQSYKNIKIIIVNDGSTDNTRRICEGLKASDNRILLINQDNKGSVEARKRGLMECSDNSYITFCDSDDKLPLNAIEKMVNCAKKYNADIVCGNMKKVWKNIIIKNQFMPDCFNVDAPTIYDKKDIIDKLYISCFGISNLPVSLCAKLYRGYLIKRAINFPNIVQFMGDDLSVTMQILPETNRLVIIPDIVYFYKIGGDTTKFMPYMIDDFLSLYRKKKELIQKYPMPQDAEYLISVELKNISYTWLKMCAEKGNMNEIQLRDEILRVCCIPEICDAVINKEMMKKEQHGYREDVQKKLVDSIYLRLMRDKRKSYIKRTIKNILYKIS